MCFSATASFGAGAVLAAIGVVNVHKAKISRQLAFAVIPFIFSVQQIAEGFMWLSLTHAEYAAWQHTAMYTYLIFAQLVWPLWVPVSMLLLEKNAIRKNILYVLLGIAITLFVASGSGMIYYPVSAETNCYHIHYTLDYPATLVLLSKIFYGTVTVVPCFVSGRKNMWMLGAAVGIAYIVTRIFYEAYAISVWCYFAALLSIIVYLHLDKPLKK